MLKFWKSTLLVMLFANVLMAETIFDLSAQHFSNSIDGNGEGARYDLPKVYVSTPLKYTNGHYINPDNTDSTYFSLEIKNPLSSWSVSFDMSYYLSNRFHPIRFTSDTGKSIILSFVYGGIYLNGDLIYDDSNFRYREDVSGTLSKDGNQVSLNINGIVTHSINISNYSKLKIVNISVLDEATDRLNGLNIGTSD